SSQSVQVPALEDEDGDAPRAADGSGDTGRATFGFALGGLGLAGLAVGTYFGVRTLDKRELSRTHCAGTQGDAEGVAALEDAHAAATISTIAFGGGAVGVGAALWLLVTRPAPPPANAMTAGARARARIAPMLGAREAGLRLEGAW